MSEENDKIEDVLNSLVSDGFDRNSTEKILDEFLEHKSKKVLFLKGAWGIGKTHFWNNYINQKMNGNEITDKRYSYVSLFGAENVKDIEELIIAGSIKPEANDVRQSSEELSKKLQDLITDIPKLKEWSGLINRICRIAIDNTLICIDDLERKDDKLSLSVVLGLVSVLKELKNCRIVIIFNENSLTEEDKKDLELYREKIVDQELTFAPTIEDNFSLIWNIKDDKGLYLPIFSKVGVNNIRVMQQTQWAIEYFSELLENSSIDIHPELKQSLLKQVCFITVFYYEKRMDIDALNLEEYFLNYTFPLASDEEEQTPEQVNTKKQMDKLHQWGFKRTDYDNLILNYLQHGKCDTEKFDLIIDMETKRLEKNYFYEEKQESWDFYWSNFKLIDNQVIDKFCEFLNKNIDHVNSKELAEIIKIIEKLDKEKYEEDIANWNSKVEKKYLDLPIDKIILLLENRFPSISDDLRKKLSEKVKESEKQEKIIPMISYIADKGGWNPKTFTLLNLKEVNDYKEEFLNSDKDDLLDTLASFYNMFHSNTGVEIKSVIRKIEQALYEISVMSDLNKMRIEIRFPEVFDKKNNKGSK